MSVSKIISPPKNWQNPFDMEGFSSSEQAAILQYAHWVAKQNGWVANEENGKLYTGPANRNVIEPVPPAPKELRLKVRYFSQRDSQVPGQWWRSCFSSSVAMLVDTVKPGVLSNSANADDEHLRRVMQYGDTTDASAQLKALKHYGVKAEFRQNLSTADLDRDLKAGRGIACGILIKGHVSAPSGGGHYVYPVGIAANGDYLVHDPYGELDMINGGYLHADGKYRLYSRKNFQRRWEVDGPGTGWGIRVTG